MKTSINFDAQHYSAILTQFLRIIHSLAEESYLVGGAVRDALSGDFPGADIDVAVRGNGFETARKTAAARRSVCTFVPLDADRGTGRLVLRVRGCPTIDVSSFKGDSIIEDLRRRDFTINAIAVSLQRFLESGWQHLIDPCNGQADLRRGIVRACSSQAFTDDPLRILRAFRFAGRLGFRIDQDTLGLMGPSLHRLPSISGERVRDELVAVLSLPNSWQTLREMDLAGVLDRLFPELSAMRGCGQNEYHHLDVWDHSLDAVRTMELLLSGELPCLGPFQEMVRAYAHEEPVLGRPRTALLKLTALFHDSGKPCTRFIDDRGKVRFFGHEQKSAEIVSAAASRLKLATRETHTVTEWVLGHMRAVILFNRSVSRRAVLRLRRKYGRDLPGLLVLFLADLAATRGPARPHGVDEVVCEQVRLALETFTETEKKPRAPLLNGRDVMEMFGLSPGPEVGKILARLAELQATGDITDQEDARAAARRIYGEE